MELWEPSKFALALTGSAEFREKAVKAIQYLAKLLDLQELSKAASAARRFMSLLKWVKYFDDARAARALPSQPLRGLACSECYVVTAMDGIQDIITLDKFNLLPFKLPKAFERTAALLDVLLASIGILIGLVKLSATKVTDELFPFAQSARVALLKSLCDFVKNVDAAKLMAPGRHLAALGGLLGAAISTDKIAFKLNAKLK